MYILHKKFSDRKKFFIFFSPRFIGDIFFKAKKPKAIRVNDVTKRGTVEMFAYNSCFPGSFRIAIVPESGTTPEIFRSIEPRALITRHSVRERLQGFSRRRWATGGGEREGGRMRGWKFRGVSTGIFPVVLAATTRVPLLP